MPTWRREQLNACIIYVFFRLGHSSFPENRQSHQCQMCLVSRLDFASFRSGIGYRFSEELCHGVSLLFLGFAAKLRQFSVENLLPFFGRESTTAFLQQALFLYVRRKTVVDSLQKNSKRFSTDNLTQLNPFRR